MGYLKRFIVTRKGHIYRVTKELKNYLEVENKIGFITKIKKECVRRLANTKEKREWRKDKPILKKVVERLSQ